MLVGIRKWRVYQANSNYNGFLVETESYDKPRGIFNQIGMHMPFIGGDEAQLEVWTQYFQNIKQHLENTYAGVTAEIIEKFHENLGAIDNPWQTK
ncbi:MAG: hypothetical protein CV087_09935 [Candidatus Brocadia sp. WS118]|nr:MAG: hypothetical protein CV087_09935 [Candidatus Brocadia sp. WS118]